MQHIPDTTRERTIPEELDIIDPEKKPSDDEDYSDDEDFAGSRILIVDDDESLGAMLGSVAQKKGHPWTLATNGLLGLKELAKGWRTNNPYQILLLDINLPQIDGIELCRICRETRIGDNNEAPGENLWIVGMSSDTSDFNVTAIMQSGADDFLPKPLTAEVVSTKLIVAQISLEKRLAERKRSWKPEWLG